MKHKPKSQRDMELSSNIAKTIGGRQRPVADPPVLRKQSIADLGLGHDYPKVMQR